MTAPYRIASGPHEGREVWIHAAGGRYTSVRYTEPGWPFPKYAVVLATAVVPNVPSTATDGEALI